MLLLCSVQVSQCELSLKRTMPVLIVKTVKPSVLFLWFGQHGSHHMCDVNYSVFTAVPFNASSFWQPTSPHQLHCLCSGCLPTILTFSKENSEVKELHLKRISACWKRIKFVHPPLHIQISKTALSCRQEFNVMKNSSCLSSAVAEMHAIGVSGWGWEPWESDAHPSQTFWRHVSSFCW